MTQQTQQPPQAQSTLGPPTDFVMGFRQVVQIMLGMQTMVSEMAKQLAAINDKLEMKK